MCAIICACLAITRRNCRRKQRSWCIIRCVAHSHRVPVIHRTLVITSSVSSGSFMCERQRTNTWTLSRYRRSAKCKTGGADSSIGRAWMTTWLLCDWKMAARRSRWLSAMIAMNGACTSIWIGFNRLSFFLQKIDLHYSSCLVWNCIELAFCSTFSKFQRNTYYVAQHPSLWIR